MITIGVSGSFGHFMVTQYVNSLLDVNHRNTAFSENGISLPLL